MAQTPTNSPDSSNAEPIKGDLLNPDTDLPLLVVDREQAQMEASPGVFRRIFNVVRFVPLIMVLVAFGGVVGLYFQPPGLQKVMSILALQPGGGTSSPIAVPITEDATAKEATGAALPSVVVGLGTLLPQGDVITVATPSGAGDARLESVGVRIGDRVVTGDIIARLDNEGRLLAAVNAARSNVRLREADLERTRVNVRTSKDEARAALESAEAAALSARQELQRAEKLLEQKITSAAAVDGLIARASQADRAVEQAQARLSRYSGSIDAQSEVQVALRTLELATADLSTAEQNLNQALIKAPIDGTILDIHSHAGEKPAAAGIVTIANIDQMIAELEIYQSQISRIDVGNTVSLTADALPTSLSGTVSRIGLEVKKQSVTDTDPAANTDARVVEVIVTLDADSSSAASRFTNLQIRATIDVGADT